MRWKTRTFTIITLYHIVYCLIREDWNFNKTRSVEDAPDTVEMQLVIEITLRRSVNIYPGQTLIFSRLQCELC